MPECSKVEKTKFHRSTLSLSSYCDLLGYDRKKIQKSVLPGFQCCCCLVGAQVSKIRVQRTIQPLTATGALCFITQVGKVSRIKLQINILPLYSGLREVRVNVFLRNACIQPSDRKIINRHHTGDLEYYISIAEYLAFCRQSN
jgi:hypothetical protein